MKQPVSRSVKTSGKSSPKVRVPKHGNGLLVTGWQQPGPGRPPSALRALLRESFADRVRIAESIADSGEHDASDRLKAIDLLAKYGLGTTKEISVESVRERVQKTVDVLRARIPADQLPPILAELKEVWA